MKPKVKPIWHIHKKVSQVTKSLKVKRTFTALVYRILKGRSPLHNGLLYKKNEWQVSFFSKIISSKPKLFPGILILT